MALKEKISDYYKLTKPGIIRGNLITAAAGFFLASKNHIHWITFIALIVGLGSVIASACVYNNYLDRGIDRKMKRTAKRALVVGTISGSSALTYATALLVFGSSVLLALTNLLTALLSWIGVVAYVVVYGYYKRRSTLSTAIGSISGAVPPVVGYVAVTGRLDMGAFILFAILVFWQMPHFFAIAMFRLKDYATAGLPVLPVTKGLHRTQVQSIIYLAAYFAATVALWATGYTGVVYLVMMTLIIGFWVGLGVSGLRNGHSDKWAKQMFLVSLLSITIQCLLISLSNWLP